MHTLTFSRSTISHCNLTLRFCYLVSLTASNTHSYPYNLSEKFISYLNVQFWFSAAVNPQRFSSIIQFCQHRCCQLHDTVIPLILKLKGLLYEDHHQPVSNNTTTVPTSVFVIQVFLKVCTIMLFFIMLFFTAFFEQSKFSE